MKKLFVDVALGLLASIAFYGAYADTPGAQEVFDGFTDAQRRDYIEWVMSAKRQPTREKRVATAAEWIGEGKKRNWKYEKC